MRLALCLAGAATFVGILAYVLHRYVRHREFIAQEQGVAVGKAFGRLSDEELFAIIYGCPIPEPSTAVRRRWWRR